jgi:hypothetical protein
MPLLGKHLPRGGQEAFTVAGGVAALGRHAPHPTYDQ